MTLLKKTIIILLSFMVVFISVTLIYLFKVSLHSYINLEEKHITGNLYIVDEIIKKEINNLDAVCRDYAFWDDTYNYTLDRNADYINKNFVESTFSIDRIDFAVITDNSGNIVYSKSYNSSENLIKELQKNVSDFIADNPEVKIVNNESKSIKGIYALSGSPLIISAEPILTSNLAGPSRGTMIFGRFLNETEKLYISEAANLNLNIIYVDSSSSNNILIKDILKDFNDGKDYYIKYESKEFASAYMPLKDIYNDIKFIISTEFTRNIYLQGLNSVIRFSYLAVIIIILIFSLTLIIIQKLFSERLVKLSKAVNEIEYKGLYSLKISDRHNDEISSLAKNIRDMLARINESEKNLIASEDKYRSLFENSVDGISIRTMDGKFIDVNNALVKILGYDSKEELMAVDIPTMIYVNRNDFNKVNSQDSNIAVIKARKKDGSIIWVEIITRMVKDDGYGFHFENIVRDVTDRIKKEEEIKYLSFYDKLTGLYNRVYLQEELDRIDNQRNLPLAITMIDINGLRIINDAFGSKSGDEVLKKIADSLKKSCRRGEIISRWSGDEFIIVLPKTTEQIAQKIGERIVGNCSRILYKNVALSISIGINVKNEESEDLHEILVEAESRMYRHKLFEMRSINSSIILSLERALREKNSETEEHADRLKQLAFAIGKKINLPVNLLDDLTLLASLHDIGKVGISDAILTKKTKLNNGEWDIIKRHPEVGYQIVKSSPQISHIADYILFHHERWDGTGYPRGLKGEEIPLISRIISIVDAYDVMIEGRIYKPALSINEVVEEMKRYSGSQFDPDLVKIFIDILKKENF